MHLYPCNSIGKETTLFEVWEGGFNSHWHNFMRVMVKSSLAEISKSNLNVFFFIKKIKINEAFVH